MESSSNLQKFKPQKLSYFNSSLLVHLVDFPIYYIECISERHFIVAGGGGSSKTGVHNQINILELVPDNDSCAADLIMKYFTPDEVPDAIMSGSLMKDLPIIRSRLITGGRNVVTYDISFDSQKKNFRIPEFEILKDKQVGAELKCVKCTSGSVMTGGIDGQLTKWNISTKDIKVERHIKAHSKEIDEIDVDPISQKVVTLSRDEGRCAVWNLSNLKLIHEFKKEFINNGALTTNVKNASSNAKYIYRSCKFAYNLISRPASNSKAPSGESFLLIACNSITKGVPSRLIKILTSNFGDFESYAVTADGIMAMTISSDGNYVALGARSGSVSIHQTSNLRKIYAIGGAHYNAVTNLQFLDPKPESLNLTNSEICPLISVSIDRRIVLHRPERRSTASRICTLVMAVLLIYFIFTLLYKWVV